MSATKSTKPPVKAKNPKDEEGELKNLPNCRFYEQQYPGTNFFFKKSLDTCDKLIMCQR
jgi:hypothetical protein